MDWLLVAGGVLLILAGVGDVFFTVLHYDGFGFISSRLYHRLFDAVCLVTRPLPRRYRAFGPSTAAPLMVPVTIVVWILLLSFGYALIYYARYQQWLPFAHRNRSFFEASARDLGYELDERLFRGFRYQIAVVR